MLEVVMVTGGYLGIGVVAAAVNGYFTGDFDDFSGMLTFLWPFVLLFGVLFLLAIGPYKLIEWAAAKGAARKEFSKKIKEEDCGVSDQPESC